MDWYKENIEEGIRPLVKLLRENGFNTECSCEHDMYVQCQILPDGELQRIHNLLFEHYDNYKIEIILERIDGIWYSSMRVEIPKESGNEAI